MEDDHIKKRRQRKSSQREKRWSMNSERLDDIVAQLMKPIGDLRHCFDTDLSALLEEYLTEAGLHALEDDEDEPAAADHNAPLVPPNFAELALLLQQSANIYGRKVDYLYKHVLQVSDSLQTSTIEIANAGGAQSEEPATPHADADAKRRRRRGAGAGAGAADYEHIALERCARARRDTAVRPPPTLPRAYLELEPRVLAPGVEPMRDYGGEPVGHVHDYQVAWRLSPAGLLVDVLAADTAEGAGGAGDAHSLRPIPLLELQAAIEAAAPPSPPPLALDDPPPCCSTPLPPDEEPDPKPEPPQPPPPPLPPPPGLRKDRKRRSDVDDCPTRIKLVVTKELVAATCVPREFDGAAAWVQRVVAARAQQLVELRRALRDAAARTPRHHHHHHHSRHSTAFQGFDYFNSAEGFAGWSASEALAARVLAEQTLAARPHTLGRRLTAGAEDSDDDGFFEQSCGTSSAGSDLSAANDTGYTGYSSTAGNTTVCSTEEAEWAAWRARVLRDAAARDAGAACDVRALAAAVLRHVPHHAPAPAPAAQVLRLAHQDAGNAPVSHLFLATLFLANAGNVEIIQGAALTPGAFSLRMLSDDAARYTAVAEMNLSTTPLVDTVLPTPKPHTSTTESTARPKATKALPTPKCLAVAALPST